MNKSFIGKKLLSLLLSVLMCVSLIPTVAFATTAEGETATVAKIGDTEYDTLEAAITAANNGDTITLGTGNFSTYGKVSTTKSLTFVGQGKDTVWTIGNLTKDVKAEGNGDYTFDGADTITFKNMTLKSDGADYRGFIRINHTVVDGCFLEGKTAFWGYGKAEFLNSTFNAPEGDYALWDYSSKEMSFDGCKFNISGKGVNVYVEAENAGEATRKVSMNDCTVNSTKANKAFLNIKNKSQAYDVVISGDNKVTGLAADKTTGSILYQVEKSDISDSGKPVKVQKKEIVDGKEVLTTIYEVKVPSADPVVAKIGDTEYKTLQAAIDAAGKSQTVTLVSDTRENVTIAKPLTLDLNGYTLNGGTVKGKPALTVTASGVTVKDSGTAQTGTIMREDTAENSGISSYYVIDVQGAGWLTFEGGNVKNNSGIVGVKGASLVRIGDDSVVKQPGLNIKGGTFTQDNFIAIKVDRGYLTLNGGTINSANSYAIENWFRATVKGGTVNGAAASWTYSGGANSTLEITGGTINGNVTSVNYGNAEDKKATVKITGGTVNGELDTRSYDPKTGELTAIDDAEKAAIEVTGGTFTNDPTRYVVEDSKITANDGKYSVAKAYLAKVGNTQYYTMDEAFKAQTTSGEDIVLLRDYKTAGTFNSGSIKRTVDLNGHTWTYTGTGINDAAFEINYSDATLTVKNGKVISNTLVGLIPTAMSGTITYDNSTLIFENVEMISNGHSGIETNGGNTNDTVTLKGCTLNVPNGYGIYFPSSGTLNIENSTINAKTMGVQVCSGSLNISNGSTINVTGDPVEKTENDGAIQDGAAISIVNRPGYKGLANVTITGGTFKSYKGEALKAYTWENKTESEFGKSNVITVSGGTFSNEIPRDYCAAGLTSSKNSDGTYTVKDITYVAEVGGVKYETVNAAIAAANNGDTVTLLSDTTEDVLINKSITLDLGGKTLTNTGVGKATISITVNNVTVKNGNVIGGASYYNIEVKKGASATLEGVTATAGNTGSSMVDNWGTLTIKSGSYIGGLNTVKSEEGSKITITGGKFVSDYAPKYGVTGTILVYGDTTITGGEFIQNSTSTAARVVVTGIVEGYTAKTVITGGNFTNRSSGAIFHGLGKATWDNFEVSGGTFNKSISAGFCADGYIPTKNNDGTYGVKKGKYVAAVGSKNYETLADAIRLAAKGKTVKLLEDITVTEQLTISKSITLDLNGKTLTSTYAMSDASGEGRYALLIKAAVTIKNGTFAAGVSRAIGAYGAMTLDGVTVTTQLTGGHACVALCANDTAYTITNSTIDGIYALSIFANNATVNVTGSKLTGDGNVLYHNGTNHGLKLTVTDTVITSTGSCGVYISGSTTTVEKGGYQQATFTKCTITGAENGVEVKYTDLTLDGCTVKTTAAAPSYKQENNGPAASGFAVVSTDNAMNGATPAPMGTITIKGDGSYTGSIGLASLASVKEQYPDFTDNTIKVSGGTFDRAVLADYCADGFIPKDNGDGTYGVTTKPAVLDTKKLTVTIGTSGEVSYTTNNGLSGTWYESFKNSQYENGTYFTVTATPDGNYQFLYWINSEGRILSENPTYSFYLNDNVTIEAVFYKTTVSTAYVVFKDFGNNILGSGRANADGTINVPEVRSHAGYKFVGWFDEKGNQYTVTDGKITVSASCTVLAKYEVDSDKLYTVTVDGKVIGEYKYDELVTVTANVPDGKYFAGWYVGDMLVSYDEVYKFYISGNTALTAKYSDEAVEKAPLVSLIVSERNTVSANEQYIVITAAWNIDSDYEISAAGILYTADANKQDKLTLENAAEDGDVYRSDSVAPDKDKLSNNGSYKYTLTLRNAYTSKNIYAVAYVTYVDGNGNSVTIYTTIQVCVA